MGRGRSRGTGLCNATAFPVASQGLSSSRDPFFANVGLLIGTGVAESQTFTDLSPTTPHTVVANGNVKYSTDVDDPFGGSDPVIKFDNVGDYLSMADDVDDGIDFGAGDFTIEYWVNKNNTSQNTYFDKFWPAGDRAYLMQGNGTTMFMSMFNTSQANMLSPTSTTYTPVVGSWSYNAFVRSGDTFKWWQDGVAIYTSSMTGTVQNQNGTFFIGAENGGAWFFDGYMAQFRITKGVARDVSTLPTGPFPTS